MPSKKRKLGDLGEGYAEMFLVKHGFSIIARNYTRNTGEIDIVAEKGRTIHFIEVKSVSRVTNSENLSAISGFYKGHVPEENVDNRKIRKIEKTSQLFLSERGLQNSFFQIDVVTVVFVDGANYPIINYIPNANLG
ncbi:MAG TPA: YraN family protein [Candidatus Paceibacterota bacterium]|nr:YraN family protein [Candidatus Paceibacterota bacterium]